LSLLLLLLVLLPVCACSPVIVGGLIPLVDTPVAIIATAEKTYQPVKVTLHSPGGHSSMPATDGSSLAARMGRLLLRISTQQSAPKIVPPTSHFVRGLAAIAPFWVRPLLLAADKVWALQWLVARVIAGLDNEAAAMVRMTSAVTNIQAGVADNAMPQVRFFAHHSFDIVKMSSWNSL
jgi:carboxypeptidase PM20D1